MACRWIRAKRWHPSGGTWRPSTCRTRNPLADSRKQRRAMRPRVPAEALPLKWTHWYRFFQDIDEGRFLANARELAGLRGELPFRTAQLDDGYQAAWGDWLECNARFPHGLASLPGRCAPASSPRGSGLLPLPRTGIPPGAGAPTVAAARHPWKTGSSRLAVLLPRSGAGSQPPGGPGTHPGAGRAAPLVGVRIRQGGFLLCRRPSRGAFRSPRHPGPGAATGPGSPARGNRRGDLPSGVRLSVRARDRHRGCHAGGP